MDQTLIRQIVEAALLAAPQPLTLAQLAGLFPEDEPAPAGGIEFDNLDGKLLPALPHALIVALARGWGRSLAGRVACPHAPTGAGAEPFARLTRVLRDDLDDVAARGRQHDRLPRHRVGMSHKLLLHVAHRLPGSIASASVSASGAMDRHWFASVSRHAASAASICPASSAASVSLSNASISATP